MISKFNWWLAVLAGCAIIFGALAYFEFEYGDLRNVTMGGEYGQVIIGEPDAWGIARLAGIAVVACYLVAPKFSAQTTAVILYSVLWGVAFVFRLIAMAIIKFRDWREVRQVRDMVGSLNRVHPAARMDVAEMRARLGVIRPREPAPEAADAPMPQDAEFDYESAVAASLDDAGPAPVGVAVAEPEVEEEEVRLRRPGRRRAGQPGRPLRRGRRGRNRRGR